MDRPVFSGEYMGRGRRRRRAPPTHHLGLTADSPIRDAFFYPDVSKYKEEALRRSGHSGQRSYSVPAIQTQLEPSPHSAHRQLFGSEVASTSTTNTTRASTATAGDGNRNKTMVTSSADSLGQVKPSEQNDNSLEEIRFHKGSGVTRIPAQRTRRHSIQLGGPGTTADAYFRDQPRSLDPLQRYVTGTTVTPTVTPPKDISQVKKSETNQLGSLSPSFRRNSTDTSRSVPSEHSSENDLLSSDISARRQRRRQKNWEVIKDKQFDNQDLSRRSHSIQFGGTGTSSSPYFRNQQPVLDQKSFGPRIIIEDTSIQDVVQNKQPDTQPSTSSRDPRGTVSSAAPHRQLFHGSKREATEDDVISFDKKSGVTKIPAARQRRHSIQFGGTDTGASPYFPRQQFPIQKQDFVGRKINVQDADTSRVAKQQPEPSAAARSKATPHTEEKVKHTEQKKPEAAKTPNIQPTDRPQDDSIVFDKKSGVTKIPAARQRRHSIQFGCSGSPHLRGDPPLLQDITQPKPLHNSPAASRTTSSQISGKTEPHQTTGTSNNSPNTNQPTQRFAFSEGYYSDSDILSSHLRGVSQPSNQQLNNSSLQTAKSREAAEQIASSDRPRRRREATSCDSKYEDILFDRFSGITRIPAQRQRRHSVQYDRGGSALLSSFEASSAPKPASRDYNQCFDDIVKKYSQELGKEYKPRVRQRVRLQENSEETKGSDTSTSHPTVRQRPERTISNDPIERQRKTSSEDQQNTSDKLSGYRELHQRTPYDTLTDQRLYNRPSDTNTSVETRELRQRIQESKPVRVRQRPSRSLSSQAVEKQSKDQVIEQKVRYNALGEPILHQRVRHQKEPTPQQTPSQSQELPENTTEPEKIHFDSSGQPRVRTRRRGRPRSYSLSDMGPSFADSSKNGGVYGTALHIHRPSISELTLEKDSYARDSDGRAFRTNDDNTSSKQLSEADKKKYTKRNIRVRRHSISTAGYPLRSAEQPTLINDFHSTEPRHFIQPASAPQPIPIQHMGYSRPHSAPHNSGYSATTEPGYNSNNQPYQLPSRQYVVRNTPRYTDTSDSDSGFAHDPNTGKSLLQPPERKSKKRIRRRRCRPLSIVNEDEVSPVSITDDDPDSYLLRESDIQGSSYWSDMNSPQNELPVSTSQPDRRDRRSSDTMVDIKQHPDQSISVAASGNVQISLNTETPMAVVGRSNENTSEFALWTKDTNPGTAVGSWRQGDFLGNSATPMVGGTPQPPHQQASHNAGYNAPVSWRQPQGGYGNAQGQPQTYGPPPSQHQLYQNNPQPYQPYGHPQQGHVQQYENLPSHQPYQAPVNNPPVSRSPYSPLSVETVGSPMSTSNRAVPAGRDALQYQQHGHHGLLQPNQNMPYQHDQYNAQPPPPPPPSLQHDALPPPPPYMPPYAPHQSRPVMPSYQAPPQPQAPYQQYPTPHQQPAPYQPYQPPMPSYQGLPQLPHMGPSIQNAVPTPYRPPQHDMTSQPPAQPMPSYPYTQQPAQPMATRQAPQQNIMPYQPEQKAQRPTTLYQPHQQMSQMSANQQPKPETVSQQKTAVSQNGEGEAEPAKQPDINIRNLRSNFEHTKGKPSSVAGPSYRRKSIGIRVVSSDEARAQTSSAAGPTTPTTPTAGGVNGHCSQTEPLTPEQRFRLNVEQRSDKWSNTSPSTPKSPTPLHAYIAEMSLSEVR